MNLLIHPVGLNFVHILSKYSIRKICHQSFDLHVHMFVFNVLQIIHRHSHEVNACLLTVAVASMIQVLPV